MKKSELRQIIREEISKVIKEDEKKEEPKKDNLFTSAFTAKPPTSEQAPS